MATSTEHDTDVPYWGLLVLISLIVTLVVHSFIIGVNATDWWKGRSMTPVDHIITSLGISRMSAQCAVTLYSIMAINSLRSPDSPLTLIIIGSIHDLFFHGNIWLTSLLSIVLCLKISNLHGRLFLYLRGLIVHRTGYFIGASVLLSAVISLITLFLAITEISNGGTYNTTIYNLQVFTDCMFINHIYHATIGVLLPFLFYCISSVLLFSSLYHHLTKMKKSSNVSINLETYYSVMKLVSFTFLCNTIYFIGLFVSTMFYYYSCVSLLWFNFVLGFLPVLHSSYLIYRTARLRTRMSKVLQNVTDFLFQRKDTETRENREVVAL